MKAPPRLHSGDLGIIEFKGCHDLRIGVPGFRADSGDNSTA